MAILALWEGLGGCFSLLDGFEEERFLEAQAHFRTFRFRSFNEALLPLVASPKLLWRQRAMGHFVPCDPATDRHVVHSLRSSLRYEDSAPWALNALARYGWNGAWERIARRLPAEREAEALSELLQGLAEIGGGRAVQAAIPFLNHQSFDVRAAALDVLSRRPDGGGAVRAALRRKLGERREALYLRLLSAKGLALRADPSGYGLALKALSRGSRPPGKAGDPGWNEDTAAVAAVCLGLIGRREAVPALDAARLRSGPLAQVYIDGALAMLGVSDAFDRVSLAMTRREFRGAAISVLGLIGSERSLTLLDALVCRLVREEFRDQVGAVHYQAAMAVVRRRWPQRAPRLARLVAEA